MEVSNLVYIDCYAYITILFQLHCMYRQAHNMASFPGFWASTNLILHKLLAPSSHDWSVVCDERDVLH